MLSTAELQASHFSIGGRVHKDSQYGTTYNVVTGAMPNRGPMKLQRVKLSDVPATKTSINLGKGNSFSYVTTNKKDFANLQRVENQVNKEYIHSIKSSHFDYGDRRP